MSEYGLDFLSRKINSIKSTLTKSELKIVNLLLQNPEEFIYLNVTDIAKKSNTSVASVTRFTKKMGYEGLSDLKLSLSKDIDTYADSSNIYDDINKDDSTGTLVEKIFNATNEALMDTKKVLKADQIEKTVEWLTQSGRVAFFGVGGSSVVAIDAHHKFIRTGKVVEVFTDTAKQMLFASIADKNDLIIAVSHEGTNHGLNESLKVAKGNGVKVVAITQYSNSPITKIADISLFTMSRETKYRPESLTSRIAAFTLTDTLYVAYAIRIYDQINHNLSKIRKNMMHLKNEEI